MNLIKNALCFATELPAAEELAAAISELAFVEVLPTHFESMGFVVNPVTNELVTKLQTGLTFTVRHDKKVIPRNVIAKETEKRVAAAELELDRELSKSEKSAIKQDVAVILAAKAMIETKLYSAYYHAAAKLLIVDCPSSPMASRIAGLLVKAMGTIKTSTIHVSDLKHGLTTRLKAYQSGDLSAFSGLSVGREVKVKNPIGREVNTYAGIDVLNSDELKNSLANNYTVDSLRFENGICNIKLTNDFQMKSITWNMPDPDVSEDEVIDKVFSWKYEADVQLIMLAKFSALLCELFNKEPELVDGEKVAKDSDE